MRDGDTLVTGTLEGEPSNVSGFYSVPSGYINRVIDGIGFSSVRLPSTSG